MYLLSYSSSAAASPALLFIDVEHLGLPSFVGNELGLNLNGPWRLVFVREQWVPVDVFLLEGEDQLQLAQTFQAVRFPAVDQRLHFEFQLADLLVTIDDGHVHILGQVLLALQHVEVESLCAERNFLSIVILHVTIAIGLLILAIVVNRQFRIDQMRYDNVVIVLFGSSASALRRSLLQHFELKSALELFHLSVLIFGKINHSIMPRHAFLAFFDFLELTLLWAGAHALLRLLL